MEFLIYIVAIFLAIISIFILRQRRSLLFLAYLTYCIFIVAPSYPIYHSSFLEYNFIPYFISMAIFQAILVFGLFIIKNNDIDVYQMSIDKNELNNSQIVISIAIMIITILYIGIGIREFGSFPLKSYFYGIRPLLFRMTFWRETLKNLPFGSLIRFIAKTGSLFIGIRLLVCRKKNIATIVLIISFIANALEGTKSSFIIWGIPLLLFYTFVKRVHVKQLFRLFFPIVIIIIGTVYLTTLENQSNAETAIRENLLPRIFIAPSKVSQMHYFFFKDSSHLYGATDNLILWLRGGPNKVFKSNALDYDNYVMRMYYYQFRNQAEIKYGGMNAPAFIYGWVDFGVFGVLLIAILSVISLSLIDNLIKKRYLSSIFIVMVFYFVIRFITSTNYLNAFFGIEGIGALLILDMLIGKETCLKGTPVMWLIFTIVLSLYLLGAVVSRLI